MKAQWNPLRGLANYFRSQHRTESERTRQEVLLDVPPPAHLKPPQIARVEADQAHPSSAMSVQAPKTPLDSIEMLLAEPFELDPVWAETEAHTLLLGASPNSAQLPSPEIPARNEQPALPASASVSPLPETLLRATLPEPNVDQKRPELLELQPSPQQTPPRRIRVYLDTTSKQAADHASLGPDLALIEPEDSLDLLTTASDFPLPEGRFTTSVLGGDDLTFHLPLQPSAPPVLPQRAQERQSARDRAEILAADLIVKHKLDIEELGELADIFELAQHALTVRAIERLFQRGATIEEVSLCFDLRCLWAQHAHYRTYYSYSRANRSRRQGLSYQTLSWGLALDLIQGFHGLPELEEVHGSLEDHFQSWCEQPPYVYDSFVAYLCAITEGYIGGLDGLHFGTRYGHS